MNPGRTPLFRSVMRAMREASMPYRTRRDFIRLTGAAGISAALGLRAQDVEKKPSKKIEGPVAVVGGGIGGLTAAYRLMQAGVEVHLYEAQERFGGRMWTKRDFNKDGMFVELGGELVDSNHTDLIDLAKELGVDLQNLKEGDEGVDFYHFGGKFYTDKDVIAAFEPLAKKIAADAEGLYDDKEEYTAKARQLDNVSLKDYLKQIGAGADRWIVQMLEVAYVPEYGIDAEKQSALNLIDFINPDTSDGFQVFGDSDEAWRVRGGNDTLPTAVQRAIQSKVKLNSGHRLVRIQEEREKIKLSFTTGSKLLTPSYANVIMALPFTILRNIDGVKELKLSEEKQRCIQEMGYGTNLKVMYGFTERLWRKPFGGRTEFCNGAVYADKSFQSVWETSRGQAGESGIITNFMGGSIGAQYGPENIEKYIAELDTIFPGLKAKADGNKTMLNWPSMKTMRGSYSSPLVGQYCWVYGAAATPELEGRLIFAGEHTSGESPGFMNGGVESGNRASKELLGEEA
ncbi:NAD(P)/FAD-dependent oxidoreductase [Prosthecobacter sp.]|uniref:flavin monoamine oxidase family protein n=1 Tax=Prosthecobacter sp. TaxID=1965333 RepID=UPI002ABBD36F|nr:NAD(P)/FAD-dependent oxidoreductase [Prosthecobacter sp.]MDZ4406257.1 NAD(P)/FAD-dependent oxidoreductase [Prosthecobacter sp.]